MNLFVVILLLIIVAIVAGIVYSGKQYSESLKNKTGLEKYLAQQNFRQADIETRHILSFLVDVPYSQEMKFQDIYKISCKDLYEIDRLWVKYSNGRFGYSVQRKIWEEHGVGYYTIFEFDPEHKHKFSGLRENHIPGSRYFIRHYGFSYVVGWWGYSRDLSNNFDCKRFGDLTFDLTAPPGHLPSHVPYASYSNEKRHPDSKRKYSDAEVPKVRILYKCESPISVFPNNTPAETIDEFAKNNVETIDEFILREQEKKSSQLNNFSLGLMKRISECHL